MKTEIQIITIGNELLEGSIQNTNVTYACHKLYEAGYLPSSQRSILDDKKTLKDEIEASLEKFDIVICSGGLGTTQDDLTLQIAAEIFKSKFHVDKKLFKRLLERYQKLLEPSLIKLAAKVPIKAELFNDHIGATPGFIFKKENKRLFLLPGVPYEFEHLIDKEVIPYIKKFYPAKIQEYKKVIHLCRIAESHLAPFLDDLLKKYPKVDFGIYPHLGILSIHVKVKCGTQKEANLILNPYIKEIRKKYAARVFESAYHTIQEAIHQFLIKKKLSLSLAESCTGGAISSSLIEIPDASKYFKGSLVCYQNEIKQNLLKVKGATLEKEGAVSEKCVIEMAKGCQKLFKSDIAIAISGIAGPKGGSKEKPVGTVFAAIAIYDKMISTFEFQITGDRKTIIKRAVNYTLAEFWMLRDTI